MVHISAEQHVSVPLVRMSWESLTFVHWRVDPGQVQALLPDDLVVDEYDGSAWVSLTPFVMANMRPLGIPDAAAGHALRGLSRIPRLTRPDTTAETNLRTYVRGPDGRDGLWFLTIHAASTALSAAIRAAVGAPYHPANMTVQRSGDSLAYAGTRRGHEESYRIAVTPGEAVVPSELEVWLTGRWRAYTLHLGRLLATPVEHEPWPLRQASLDSLEHSLTRCVGLPEMGDPALVQFSDGVQHVRLGRPTLLPAT